MADGGYTPLAGLEAAIRMNHPAVLAREPETDAIQGEVRAVLNVC